MRDRIRNLTRMRRLRICAAWRPDAAGYRDPTVATRLSLKSLARRILDLDDEIAELDRFIAPLVEELAPDLLKQVFLVAGSPWRGIGSKRALYQLMPQMLISLRSGRPRLTSVCRSRCLTLLKRSTFGTASHAESRGTVIGSGCAAGHNASADRCP